MSITHIAPYFVLSALFLLAARLIVRHVDFFHQSVQLSPPARYPTLDGLRGFLAVGVLFDHAIDSYQYFQTGELNYPETTFYAFLGDGAVCLFFMITGFLFWSKAIAGGKFELKKFYLARFLRIYPIYWLSLGLVILIILIESGFSLKVSGFSLISQTMTWMTCGLFDFPFIHGIDYASFFPSINTFEPAVINSGVFWTLVYELQFYLVFPLLMLFVQPLRFIALLVSTLLVYKFFPNGQIPLILCFLFGMLAAYLVYHFRLEQIFSHWVFSIIAFLLLGTIPLALQKSFHPGTFPIAFSLAMFVVFLVLVYGNSLFGLLTTPASRYLGKISYDLYLLHGIVLFIVLSSINSLHPIKAIEPILYWSLIALAGLIAISVSGLTHRYIEYPFMQAQSMPRFLTKLLRPRRAKELPDQR